VPIESARIEQLARDLDRIAIHTEPHYRISYTYDAAGVRGQCGGVAFPVGPDELHALVRESHRRGIPVFVRGAGTGFSGGSVPLEGGLVVSTERMARVLSFDEEAREIEVESGIVNKEVQDFLEIRGYFYPPDPASFRVSTIGGNIAENAGGPRAYKYGVTRRYVRALRWITAAGESLHTPPDDAAALLVGAEGTLGVIYAARLGVLALPEAHRTSLVAAASGVGAIAEAAALLEAGCVPSVLEFIDEKTMACVSEYRGLSGLDEHSSYLFIELDGMLEEVELQYQILRNHCRRRGLALFTARGGEERESLWELRRAVSPSLARRGVTKVNEDVSLPLGSLGEIVSYAGRIAGELSLDCYLFGHCGDGNLHVNIMTDRRRHEEMERVEYFVERIFARVVELGGTISGEHGIGMTKSRYLDMVFSPAELALQRGVKRAMDGTGLLNPGKYFGA
jgi:glycolate oxidase